MPREEKKSFPLWLGILLGVLVLGGGLFFMLYDSKPKIERSPDMNTFENTP